MSFDEEGNSSNRSNSTDNLPKELLISYAVIQLLFFSFSLFLVIYLSIRLKKRAWDSPAKRFANTFNVCFALLTLFIFIEVNFRIFGTHFDIPLFILDPLWLANNLYFIAMYVALSLQIVTPFLPERLKLYARKTHCVNLTEVTSHVLFLLLAIYSAVLNYNNFEFLHHIVMYIVLIAFILSYSFLFLTFGFWKRFFKYQKKGVKYMIIKLLFLFIIFILYVILFVLFSGFQTNFWSILLLILYWADYFILSISVVSLNHPLDIWYYKCCFRRSPGREPLLPVNDTEGQQTNPVSVWDHRNVPSSTVTHLPFDMSDCRSDYEQLA